MAVSVYRLLWQVCGLSHADAADLFDVRIDTVKSWAGGRNPAPPAVLDELASLAARIDAAADEAVEACLAEAEKNGSMPDTVEIGVASDDHEAQSLGWPCAGVHQAVIGLAVARGIAEGFSFTVVPRGATPASAAAADAHRR